MQCALPTPFVFFYFFGVVYLRLPASKIQWKTHKIAQNCVQNDQKLSAGVEEVGGGRWRKRGGGETWELGEERHGCWGDRRPCLLQPQLDYTGKISRCGVKTSSVDEADDRWLTFRWLYTWPHENILNVDWSWRCAVDDLTAHSLTPGNPACRDRAHNLTRSLLRQTTSIVSFPVIYHAYMTSVQQF